jgi:hypothetical protein
MQNSATEMPLSHFRQKFPSQWLTVHVPLDRTIDEPGSDDGLEWWSMFELLKDAHDIGKLTGLQTGFHGRIDNSDQVLLFLGALWPRFTRTHKNHSG